MLPGSDHHPLPAPLLTPKALCVQLSICPRSYSRLVRAGLPHVLVLTARRYDIAEVVAWLRVQTPKGAAVGRSRMPSVSDDQLVRHLKLLARGRR
jgi:hypothetical protein